MVVGLGGPKSSLFGHDMTNRFDFSRALHRGWSLSKSGRFMRLMRKFRSSAVLPLKERLINGFGCAGLVA